MTVLLAPDVDDRAPDRAPITLPRGRAAFLLPLLAAVGLGLAAALWPLPTLVAGLGVLIAAVLLVRLEWAVVAVVVASVFPAYLDRVDPLAGPALVVVLLGSWVVRRSRGRLQTGPPSPVLIAASAFLVPALLAALVHPNGQVGTHQLVLLLGYLAVLVVLVDCLRSFVRPVLVARAYVAACSVAAACALLTYALGAERRVAGPVAEPDVLAFLLVAAVPLAFSLRRLGRRAWVYDAATVVLVVTTLGTVSRGALVGLVALVVFALAARMINVRVFVGLVLIVGTGLVTVVSSTPVHIDLSAAQRRDVAAQGAPQLLETWRAAASMTADHPLLGLGPGAFELYHQDYRAGLGVEAADEPVGDTTDREVTRNTYLGVSAEIGVLGLLALLAVWGAGLLGAWTRWRADRHALAAGVCAALVGSLVTAASVTGLHVLTLWLLAALGASLGQPRERPMISASLVRLRGNRDPAGPR